MPIATSAALPACAHEDFTEGCLACLIEDELPQEVKLLSTGKLAFIRDDGTTHWKYNDFNDRWTCTRRE